VDGRVRGVGGVHVGVAGGILRRDTCDVQWLELRARLHRGVEAFGPRPSGASSLDGCCQFRGENHPGSMARAMRASHQRYIASAAEFSGSWTQRGARGVN
jgi:hypothetical protein